MKIILTKTEANKLAWLVLEGIDSMEAMVDSQHCSYFLEDKQSKEYYEAKKQFEVHNKFVDKLFKRLRRGLKIDEKKSTAMRYERRYEGDDEENP